MTTTAYAQFPGLMGDNRCVLRKIIELEDRTINEWN